MSDKKLTVRFPSALTLLTLVFVTLKLAEIGAVSTWSWWWVLSPLWLPFAVILAVGAVAVICAAVLDLLD